MVISAESTASDKTRNNKVAGMLFGHPIVNNTAVTYTEQIHDILAEMIQKGRWHVGDRLPSISIMVEECGLSRFPIQLALNQLAEEGYIRQEDRKGSFLMSQFPQGRPPVGTVGVVVARDMEEKDLAVPDTYHMQALHLVHEVAARFHFLPEIQFVDWESDMSDLNAPDGPFGGRVCGVLALNTTHHVTHFDGLRRAGGRVPMVFLSQPTDTLVLPCIGSDSWYGIYQLTQRVIDAGHRKISIFCDPAYSVPMPAPLRELHARMLEQNLLSAHRVAMREAGLAVDEAAIDWSRALPYSSLAFVREFLERFGDATAVIGLRGSAMNLVAVAEMLGRRVPEDLSVVAGMSGPYPMRPGDNSRLITGVSYAFRESLMRAFGMISEVLETGACATARVWVAPAFTEGHSLAAPRGQA